MHPAPKSVLFLSADLVGSTSFKQSIDGWQKVFLTFYRGLPQYVARVNRKMPSERVIDFNLWKAIGDELIFQVDVQDATHVADAVRIWLEAMHLYESEVLQENSGQLKLKGGAFIATFPGPDSESTIPISPESEDSDSDVIILNDSALNSKRDHALFMYDYFGPSIDTGFRILGESSHRFFTLSVEAAWAIADSATDAKRRGDIDFVDGTHDFVFMGEQPLKGVWDGRSYPLFAIDRKFDDNLHAALRKISGSQLTSELVANVCQACSNSPGWVFKIYLPESSNKAFHNVPSDAMAVLRGAALSNEGAEIPATENGNLDLESDPPLG
ncbi:hypothetical protein [Rhodoluna limnophila]|jgi:hypothetical protein|uniref:hypothetical protein n=1 Tax=Rhodoluna limnophila TaxID=232537 RepID=UPI0011058E3B|nr:hypothetical protein [Rhodoluna limnophila]